MNQLIYWKNPTPRTAMEEDCFWPVGFGPATDMPEGAMTGDRELPRTLQSGWRDIEKRGRNGEPVIERVFELVSPPHIERRTATRAYVALTEEDLRWLNSAENSTFQVLAMCLRKINEQRICGPLNGTRRTNWWWLVHDGWWLPGAARLPLKKRWFRAMIEVIAAGHPNLSTILATWDRWIEGDPQFPYGKKTAGRLVIANEPCVCRNGSCIQVFELRPSPKSARPYLYRCSGHNRYSISLRDVQPVCDESLEEMNVSPVVGLAAMLADHGRQMKAAPSAHARLVLEARFEPVFEKWSERLVSWRAQALSRVAFLSEAERRALIDRPLEAAITALLAFTGVTDTKVAGNLAAGSTGDARAQDVFDALIAMRESLAMRRNSPAD